MTSGQSIDTSLCTALRCIALTYWLFLFVCSETREFKKSITKWIDVDGNIAEDIVRKDMSKFVEAFETSQYKKSK